VTRIKEELFCCLFEDWDRLSQAPRPRGRAEFLAGRPVFEVLAEERAGYAVLQRHTAALERRVADLAARLRIGLSGRDAVGGDAAGGGFDHRHGDTRGDIMMGLQRRSPRQLRRPRSATMQTQSYNSSLARTDGPLPAPPPPRQLARALVGPRQFEKFLPQQLLPRRRHRAHPEPLERRPANEPPDPAELLPVPLSGQSYSKEGLHHVHMSSASSVRAATGLPVGGNRSDLAGPGSGGAGIAGGGGGVFGEARLLVQRVVTQLDAVDIFYDEMDHRSGGGTRAAVLPAGGAGQAGSGSIFFKRRRADREARWSDFVRYLARHPADRLPSVAGLQAVYDSWRAGLGYVAEFATMLRALQRHGQVLPVGAGSAGGRDGEKELRYAEPFGEDLDLSSSEEENVDFLLQVLLLQVLLNLTPFYTGSSILSLQVVGPRKCPKA
jgi:hypothetical protein